MVEQQIPSASGLDFVKRHCPIKGRRCKSCTLVSWNHKEPECKTVEAGQMCLIVFFFMDSTEISALNEQQ